MTVWSKRARPQNNEMGSRTAMLSRGRVLLAQNEHEAARQDLQPAHSYFHEQGLYYYEAQACNRARRLRF